MVLESFLSPALEGATSGSVEIFKAALTKVKEARAKMNECVRVGDYAGAAKAAREAAKVAKSAQQLILRLEPDMSSTVLTDLGIMVGTMLFSICINGRTYLSSSSKKTLSYGAYDDAVSKARDIQQSKVKQIAADTQSQLKASRAARDAALREANAKKARQKDMMEIAIKQHSKVDTLWKESYKMELEASQEFRENVEKFYSENMTNREKLIASVHPLKIFSHAVPQVAPLVAFIQTAQKKKLLMTNGDETAAKLNANDFNLIVDCIKNMLQGISDRYLRLAEDHESEVEYLKRRDTDAALESALNCAMRGTLSISTEPLTVGEPYPQLIPLYDLAAESTLLHVAIDNGQCGEAVMHAANCEQICHDLALENDSPEARVSLASAQSQFHAIESTLAELTNDPSEEKRDNYLETFGEISLECLFQDLDREMDDALEGIILAPISPAMEGVTADAFAMWRANKKALKAAKSNMKDAIRHNDYKAAAQYAKECSKLCDQTVKLIESFPQDASATVLVNAAIVVMTFLVIAGSMFAASKIQGKRSAKSSADLKERQNDLNVRRDFLYNQYDSSEGWSQTEQRDFIDQMLHAETKHLADEAARLKRNGITAKAVGAAVGAAASAFPGIKGISSIFKQLSARKKEGAEMTANDKNVLIAAMKDDIRKAKADFDRLALRYTQMRTIVETEIADESDSYYVMSAYADIVLENFMEFEPLVPAMEGTNIDAIKSWREHRKMIAATRKEMKAAAKGKNFELASEKATECAKIARMLVTDIDNLPDSTPSALLINLGIQLLAFYVGNKALAQIMGHQSKKTDKPNPIEFLKGKRTTVQYTKQQQAIRNTTSGVTQKVMDKTRVSKLGTANMKENAGWVRRQIGQRVDAMPEKAANYATMQYGALGAGIARLSTNFALGKALRALANKAGNPQRAEGEEKANDNNTLLNALKVDANGLAKKFEKKAAEYKQAARTGHAATEAAENFIGDSIEKALEGATFDFLGSYFKHWRDLQRTRKDMYEAAKAARYEIARAKAFECCDIAADMKRDLTTCSDEANKCAVIVQLAIATAMFMIKTVQMYQFFRADNLNKAAKLEAELKQKYPGKSDIEIPEPDAWKSIEAAVLRNEPIIAVADSVETAALIQAINRPANRLSRAFSLLRKKKIISDNGSVDTSGMQEREGNEVLKAINSDVDSMIDYFKEFAKYWDRRANEPMYVGKGTESWLFDQEG